MKLLIPVGESVAHVCRGVWVLIRGGRDKSSESDGAGDGRRDSGRPGVRGAAAAAAARDAE